MNRRLGILCNYCLVLLRCRDEFPRHLCLIHSICIVCIYACIRTHTDTHANCPYLFIHTTHMCMLKPEVDVDIVHPHVLLSASSTEGCSLSQECSYSTSLLISLILSLRIAGGLLYLHASEDPKSSSHFWQELCSLSDLHSLLWIAVISFSVTYY